MDPKNFICTRCGNCCKKFTVKISDKEIKRIQKLGYKKNYFAVADEFDAKTGKYALKHVNNQCIFLTKKYNKYSCQIHSSRPDICRIYPFFDPVDISCPGIKEA